MVRWLHIFNIEINLNSVKLVEEMAFRITALKDAVFGNNLESIEAEAFADCPSRERIAIPLRLRQDVLFFGIDTFHGCVKLQHVNLVEDVVMRKTVAALLWDEWRNDMDRVIDEVNNFFLPSATAGGRYRYDVGEKIYVIIGWGDKVRRKIIDYKAQYRNILSEAESILSHDLRKRDCD